MLYVTWLPRNSTRAACIVDSLSKGSLEAAMIPGFPTQFPRLPRAFRDWLRNPRIDDFLGPDILDELASSGCGAPLLGYNV